MWVILKGKNLRVASIRRENYLCRRNHLLMSIYSSKTDNYLFIFYIDYLHKFWGSYLMHIIFYRGYQALFKGSRMQFKILHLGKPYSSSCQLHGCCLVHSMISAMPLFQHCVTMQQRLCTTMHCVSHLHHTHLHHTFINYPCHNSCPSYRQYPTLRYLKPTLCNTTSPTHLFTHTAELQHSAIVHCYLSLPFFHKLLLALLAPPPTHYTVYWCPFVNFSPASFLSLSHLAA